MSLTLTVAEIIDLAGFAGLTLHTRFLPTGDDLDVEIVVTDCPKSGLADDYGIPAHFKHIAYLADCPEEGSAGLGAAQGTADGGA